MAETNDDVVISIVLATWNDAETIEQCLSSIERLSYPSEKRETIVVDGGSTDGTREVIQRYDCQLVDQRGTGLSDAREQGASLATGEFVAFTDADCVVTEDWLTNLVENFDAGEEIGSVGGPHITPDDESRFGKSVGRVLKLLSGVGPRYRYEGTELIETFHNPGCNAMYRTSIFEEIDGFADLTTAEDEELDFRVREHGYTILYEPDAKVYHYRCQSWDEFKSMAYRYGKGRAEAIDLHNEMGEWFHYFPTVSATAILSLAVLSVVVPLALPLVVLVVAAGSVSLLGLSGYLAVQSDDLGRAPTYATLLSYWYIWWAVGFARGRLG